MRPTARNPSRKRPPINELRSWRRPPGARPARSVPRARFGHVYFLGKFDISELQRLQRLRCRLTLAPQRGQRSAFSFRTNLVRVRVFMAGQFSRN